MNGKAATSSFLGWVKRDCRAYAGSRGMAHASLLPIRERRLRPWERSVRSIRSFASSLDLSTKRSWQAWTRSLRVRALRFENRSCERRLRAGSKWPAMSRYSPARLRAAGRAYACSE